MRTTIEKLKPGDIISYTGNKDDDYKLFQKAIRIVSSGVKNYNNKSIPIHSGIVVKHKGKLKLAEMKINGLEIVSLKRDSEHVKGVTRFKLNEKERNKLNKNIISDYEKGETKYDKLAPITFLFKNKEKKDAKAVTCSEYIANVVDKNTRYDPTKLFHRMTPRDFEVGKSISLSKSGKKVIRGSGSRFIKKENLEKFAKLFTM